LQSQKCHDFDSILISWISVINGLLPDYNHHQVDPVCESKKRSGVAFIQIAAWQLLNQLGSEILLRFPFVLGRREAEFDCPDIWHSPILMWQLPESLLNLLYKQLVDTGFETLLK
jgi:hypothetical protein